MISEMILYGVFFGSIVVKRLSHTNHGNAAFIIHDVQVEILLNSRIAEAAFSVVLKGCTKVNSRAVVITSDDQFFYPLPSGVIKVECIDRGRAGVGLVAEHLHAIQMIPLEMAGGMFAHHIATGIVKMALRHRGWSRGAAASIFDMREAVAGGIGPLASQMVGHFASPLVRAPAVHAKAP